MKKAEIISNILHMKFTFRTENLPPLISVIVIPNMTLEHFTSAWQGLAKLEVGADCHWPGGCSEWGVAYGNLAAGSACWLL